MGFIIFGEKMQELTDQQKKKLLKNPNVERITDKHVVYTSKFKIKAVERYHSGEHPDDIFKSSGIPPGFFKARYCKHCIGRWKAKYQNEGKESLKQNKTGKNASGRPKKMDLNELTVEELKAVIEIQEDFINLLKKRRPLMREKLNNGLMESLREKHLKKK